MKITKTPEEIEYKRKQKEKANLGCDICPFCGEKKNIEHVSTAFIKPFLTHRVYNIDNYKCYACKAEWSSDKYEA